MINKNPYGISKAFGTTADLGIQVRTVSLEQLFAASAWAMTELISEPIPTEKPIRLKLNLSASSLDSLLFDWLNEIIFIFETRKILSARFEVELAGNSLSATLIGSVFAPEFQELKVAPKAVTMHELKVRKDRYGWFARFIIDI